MGSLHYSARFAFYGRTAQRRDTNGGGRNAATIPREGKSMNDETNIATPETPEADHDDWDDIDLEGVSDDGDDTPTAEEEGGEETPEEAEQEEGKEQPTADEPTEEAEPKTTPETFELKHLGEVKQVSREEMITLAQKGLNYDHIREERDNAKAEAARLGEYESFLKELADRDKISVDDFVDRLKARMLADKDKISPDVALERVKLDRERRAFNAQKAAADEAKNKEEAENKRVRESLLKFSQEYPDVKPQEITQEMWQAVRDGGDLSAIYARQENKTLKTQIAELNRKLEAEKQNSKNKERAAGSRQSAGKGNEMDALDRAWYDGT